MRRAMDMPGAIQRPDPAFGERTNIELSYGRVSA